VRVIRKRRTRSRTDLSDSSESEDSSILRVQSPTRTENTSENMVEKILEEREDGSQAAGRGEKHST
jgi:hypothetical protein